MIFAMRPESWLLIECNYYYYCKITGKKAAGDNDSGRDDLVSGNGGQVVSIRAFSSDDPSSISADVQIIFLIYHTTAGLLFDRFKFNQTCKFVTSFQSLSSNAT